MQQHAVRKRTFRIFRYFYIRKMENGLRMPKTGYQYLASSIFKYETLFLMSKTTFNL